ncbi:hypothetical protein EDD11_002385 [Mortierella claussenii]|nr:hypothetical protein EDD11_002385 [Mortierella claussenii]
MAKKMERLEMSTDFRPFKFRIQAFTNAFHDDLVQNGLSEDILPLRKVKVYLWKHRYISRFNEDGKKQKSKGNHVWNIEARKISQPQQQHIRHHHHSEDAILLNNNSSSNHNSNNHNNHGGGNNRLDLKSIGPDAIAAAGGGVGFVRRQTSPVRWEFREYSSRIAGQIIKFARVGVPYVYSPRIWDAQMSCPAAKFSSPWLPGWLKWHKGELKGIPGPEDESCTITVVAEYVREGEECRLEMSFPLTVSDPSKEGELLDSQNEHDDEDELEDDDHRPNHRNHGLWSEERRQSSSLRHQPHHHFSQLQDQQQQQQQHNQHQQQQHNQQSEQHHYQQQYHHQDSREHSCTHIHNHSHHQAQQQLQHLHLQEQPHQHYQQPCRRSGHSSEEDLMSSDGSKEMAMAMDPIHDGEEKEVKMEDVNGGEERETEAEAEGEAKDEEVGGEDGSGKMHVRKQSRERRSMLLMQDTKRRRKHDP